MKMWSDEDSTSERYLASLIRSAFSDDPLDIRNDIAASGDGLLLLGDDLQNAL